MNHDVLLQFNNIDVYKEIAPDLIGVFILSFLASVAVEHVPRQCPP
jgi:hypothetical protein